MKNKMVEISYMLSKNTFTPGNIKPPLLRARSRIVKCPEGMGETETRWESYNNTSIIEIFAHAGTHIDAPFHIDQNGLTIDAFEIEDFVFDEPMFVNLPKSDLEKITKDDLSVYKDELKKSDLLLVYTGFSKYRESDPERYIKMQPGFSTEAAEYIISNFPIRAVGIDTPGIENIGKAKPEFPVHKIFLKSGKKFFLIEDANLVSILGKNLLRVYTIPLNFKDAEAMSIRAFAEVKE